MTEHQLPEIRNYLLAKKLPIDILIEVNDHFVSQILDIQREENLGFDEAFEKVKENWKEELTFEAVPKSTAVPRPFISIPFEPSVAVVLL